MFCDTSDGPGLPTATGTRLPAVTGELSNLAASAVQPRAQAGTGNGRVVRDLADRFSLVTMLIVQPSTGSACAENRS
jgi:hypothetical protein